MRTWVKQKENREQKGKLKNVRLQKYSRLEKNKKYERLESRGRFPREYYTMSLNRKSF